MKILLLLFFLIIPAFVLAWCFAMDGLARLRIYEPPGPASGPDSRFTVLIPAHDEESCISGVLKSITQQTYPAFEAYVILDCCSDSTKEIVSAFTGIGIIEKTTASTCKGDALNEAIRRLQNEGRLLDAVVIIDADSPVNPKFLEALNAQYRMGAKAVMADTNTLNPYESLVCGWYTLYWKMVSEMSRSTHAKLHLSGNLCGSGMSFRRECLRETITLTEDVEYFMALGCEGTRIDYAPDALVYQEQPRTLRDMIRQLYRWMNGVQSVNKHYRKAFLASLCRAFSFQKFDAFMTSQACTALGVLTLLTLLYIVIGCLFSPALLFAAGVLILLTWLIATKTAITVTRRCGLDRRKLRRVIPTYYFFLAAMGLIYVYAIVFPGNTWMKVDRKNGSNRYES